MYANISQKLGWWRTTEDSLAITSVAAYEVETQEPFRERSASRKDRARDARTRIGNADIMRSDGDVDALALRGAPLGRKAEETVAQEQQQTENKRQTPSGDQTSIESEEGSEEGELGRLSQFKQTIYSVSAAAVVAAGNGSRAWLNGKWGTPTNTSAPTASTPADSTRTREIESTAAQTSGASQMSPEVYAQIEDSVDRSLPEMSVDMSVQRSSTTTGVTFMSSSGNSRRNSSSSSPEADLTKDTVRKRHMVFDSINALLSRN